MTAKITPIRENRKWSQPEKSADPKINEIGLFAKRS
jgi:hypothetical protein